MLNHEDHKSGVTLSPKASFLLGLVGGVLVLCTLGFFILLWLTLRGGLGSVKADTYVPSAGGAPSAAAPEPAIGKPKAVSSADHVQGTKNAQVTLYEYSDFQCPFCSRFHPTMKQLMDAPEYKGKLQWVYRHYPLSFHPQATPSANAAECASEQGKFWEYADSLFAGQEKLSDAFYGELADQHKLNRSKFDSCYAAKKYNARITADQADGTAAGVTGTPGTVIVAKDGSVSLVPGAVGYDQLKTMVDAALAKK